MRKKLLIVICEMLMMFGSALSVSAEETTTTVTGSYSYRIYVDEGTIGPNFSSEWSHIYDGTLTTNYQACFIFSEIPNSENYPEIKGQYRINYYQPAFACLGNANVVVGGSYDCETYDEYSTKTGTLQEDLSATYGFSGVDVFFVIGNDGSFETTIPIFENEDDALNYFLYGDSSGMMNDLYDEMETDETFGLTGFTADNTITASWTGTTHDDVIDTYNQADVGIRPWYYYKSSPEMLGFKSTVIEEYEIANKTFTKLYDELTPSDETLFLRCLEVIPTYQKESLGAVYKGKSCWIWFDEDGNVEKIVNDIHEDYPEEFYDSSFNLYSVDVSTGPTSYITGKLSHKISWSGSTKDDVIKTIDLDKTYISVFFYGGLEDGSMKLYDYEDIYTYGDILRIHSSTSYKGNSFEFMTQQAIDACEKEGRTFMGEVWLTPYCTVDNCIYKGKVSVVNVLTGQVGSVDPDNPDDPVYEDDPTDEDGDDDSFIPDLDDIDDITDIFPYFISLIKSFINGCGQLPAFYSYLFPMLPNEITYMLVFGIVIVFILRVLGR